MRIMRLLTGVIPACLHRAPRGSIRPARPHRGLSPTNSV